MVHALEESWRVLTPGGRLIDLRPTAPSWFVEVISQNGEMVAGNFGDATRMSEDVSSNQAIAEIQAHRFFQEEYIDFFDFEYYWGSVDGMVEHVEYDWLDEATVPEDVVNETRRLLQMARGRTEIRIKRKMIFARYTKLAS